MKKAIASITVFGALAVAPIAAVADDDLDDDTDDTDIYVVPSPSQQTTTTTTDSDYYATVSPEPYSYAWREPRMASEIGIGVIIGGGVAGFTDELMRDSIENEVGGLWSARVSIGTHIPIGLDLNYVGSASALRTLADEDNGTLIGTTLEAAARINLLPHNVVNPYIFGGIGWQRYDVSDANFAQSATGLRSEDDLVVFPLGAGLSFRSLTGLVVDVRGTVRVADDSGLLSLREGTDGNAELHTWEASAALGYEF
jgi:hypothetical protein